MQTSNKPITLYGTDAERLAYQLPGEISKQGYIWVTPDLRIYESLGQSWRESSRGLPADMLTSENEAYRRLQVDVSQTGFWEGREFRISYPLSIATTSQVVLRFTSPVDFVLMRQTLSCDKESLRFRAYREGTEGGTWSDIDIYKNNFTAEAEALAYTRQASITTGGTFTPSSNPSETVRILTANASGQTSTVGGEAVGERGLGAGTYYLVFDNYTGNGTATGVYDLIWEERP